MKAIITSIQRDGNRITVRHTSTLERVVRLLYTDGVIAGYILTEQVGSIKVLARASYDETKPERERGGGPAVVEVKLEGKLARFFSLKPENATDVDQINSAVEYIVKERNTDEEWNQQNTEAERKRNSQRG